MLGLTNSGVISENTFSFNMAPKGSASSIDFGAPQESNMKNPEDLVYIDMLDDFFWSANCQGFAIGSASKGYRWGSIDGSKTVKNGSVYSIFDTGASALILPRDYF